MLSPPAELPSPLPLVRLQAQLSGRLSEAQQRFNQRLQRIDFLSGQIQGLQEWSNRHLYGHVQALQESARQTADLDKAMLLLLHGRLADGALTASLQRTARAQVRSLLRRLAGQADPQVQALWPHYQLQEDAHEDADENDREAAPTEQDLHLWRQHQARVERKTAKREARKARKNPAAHERAQQQHADAGTVLRTIFRQLASALHPDREPEATLRDRKTDLMSQANAAYERKELATLLRLQLQVAEVDPDAITRMTDDRVRALSLLLKDQVLALEADLSQLELRLTCALGVPVAAAQGEQALTESIQRLQADQRLGLTNLASEYAQVQTDAGLKRWLKDQARLMRLCARDAIGD